MAGSAQIPVYDAPKVQQQATPTGGYLQAQAPDPLAPVGQGLMAVGKDIDEAEFNRSRFAANVVMDPIRDQATKMLTDYKNKLGDQAVAPILDDNGQPVERIDGKPYTQADSIKDQLGTFARERVAGANLNPGTSALVEHQLDRLLRDAETHATDHYNQQKKVNDVQTQDGLISSSLARIAANPSSLMDEMAVLTDTAHGKADTLGLPGPAREQTVQTAQSAGLLTAIKGLYQNNPQQAAKIYADNKDLFTAQDAEHAKAYADQGSNMLQAVNATDNILVTLPRDVHTRLFSIADAHEQLKQQLKDGTISGDVFKLGMGMIDSQHNVDTQDHTNRVQGSIAGTFAAWNQQGNAHNISGLINSDAYQQLLAVDPHTATTTLEYFKDSLKPKVEPPTFGQIQKYNDMLSDPTLLQWTSQKIQTEAAKLGYGLGSKFINDIGEYKRTPEKLDTWNADHDILKAQLLLDKDYKDAKPAEQAQIEHTWQSQLKIMEERDSKQGIKWSKTQTLANIGDMRTQVANGTADWHFFGPDTDAKSPLASVMQNTTLPPAFVQSYVALKKAQWNAVNNPTGQRTNVAPMPPISTVELFNAHGSLLRQKLLAPNGAILQPGAPAVKTKTELWIDPTVLPSSTGE